MEAKGSSSSKTIVLSKSSERKKTLFDAEDAIVDCCAFVSVFDLNLCSIDVLGGLSARFELYGKSSESTGSEEMENQLSCVRLWA